jgi:hypothetical protein
MALAVPLGATPVLDQQVDPRVTGGGAYLVMYRGGYFSQTFTVGVDGRLAGVDVLMSRRELLQTDVLFEISPTLDGVPAPTMGLPSHGAIPFAMIPVDPEGMAGAAQDWVHLDLAMHDIAVTAGQQLAIVLKLNTPPGPPPPPDPMHSFDIVWHASMTDPYPPGGAFAHPTIPGSPWNPIAVVDAGFRTWVEAVETIAIDVRPGDGLAAIHPQSGGLLAVALLGGAESDVAQVDPASVRVAGVPPRTLPNGRPMAAIEDCNGDGFLDLVVHVGVADLELAGDEMEILVTAATWSGTALRGSDTVRIVP